MTCSDIRTALSARIDDEALAGFEHDRVDDHLARCASCRQWLVVVTAATSRVRADAASLPEHDLTASVVATADRTTARRPLAPASTRLALATVAVLQVVVALPVVVGVDGHHSHATHEAASWNLALAVGFLVAALRPARAWGMLPLVGAAVVCMLGSAALDAAAGHASVGAEAPHLLSLAGLALTAAMVFRAPRPRMLRLRTA